MKRYAPFLYSLGTNALSFCISALTTFVVPKLLGATNYGYWQLYLFYVSYIGIFHFGWNDGIYLRYGGSNYNDLDKDSLYEQFCIELILQFLIAICIIILTSVFYDPYKRTVLLWVAVCMIITNITSMFVYILQMTSRIKEYAIINTIDRGLFGVFVVLLLSKNSDNFESLIGGDLTCRLLSLILALLFCKDIFKMKSRKWKGIFTEIWKNIDVGSKLMFANLAGMLITGIVRFGIEHIWSIEIFGKISLTISISNFLIIFINSVGIVIYPMLRNIEADYRRTIFIKLNNAFVYAYVILLVFFPFKIFINLLLPEYTDSIIYMATLFPICIYEGKISLLYLTYLKALRKEKEILYINVITVLISIILTFITTYLLKNLFLSVFSITILMFIRSTLNELYLGMVLNIKNIWVNVIFELILSSAFIISTTTLQSNITAAIYLALYLLIIGTYRIVSPLYSVKKY